MAEPEFLAWIEDYESYCELLDDEEQTQSLMRSVFQQALAQHRFFRVQMKMADFEIRRLPASAQEEQSLLSSCTSVVDQ